MHGHELFSANVHFYGGVTRRQEGQPIRAWVDVPPNAPIVTEQRNALAYLIPLSAAHTLYQTKRVPEFTDLFVERLRVVAETILNSETEARQVSFEGEDMYLPAPQLIDASEGRSRRIFRATLYEDPQTHGLTGIAKAPWKGGQAYFATCGVLALIEHACRGADYDETLRPALSGVLLLSKMAETLDGFWQDQGIEANFLWAQAIVDLVVEDDPVAVLIARLRELTEQKRDRETQQFIDLADS